MFVLLDSDSHVVYLSLITEPSLLDAFTCRQPSLVSFFVSASSFMSNFCVFTNSLTCLDEMKANSEYWQTFHAKDKKH